MGLAGGLLPSPSALVVLLATVAVGKPWLGVLLVLAFGVGMAGTLAATALVVSRVRDRVVRADALFGGRLASVARVLPLLLASTVVALGLALLARGLAAASA
jgi:ABC-type nickel/cobalt efflux system permease component RcnA